MTRVRKKVWNKLPVEQRGPKMTSTS